MKYLFLLIALWAAPLAFGQSLSVSGTLQDAHGTPLASREVTMRTQKDSVLVKVALTDTKGVFKFGSLTTGNYILAINNSGKSVKKTVNLNQSTDLGTITLDENNYVNIKEVVVKKPLIEKAINKTVINIENSSYKTGADTYSLLNIAPELQTDNVGNITFRGTESVVLYVDGKKVQLQGRELMDYLKSIPSESIKNIEISSVPSAEYDAANSGAIININTKDNYKYGLTGTVYAELQQHRYFQWSSGFFLKYRKKNLITQASYSYGTGRGFTTSDATQTFFDKPLQYTQHQDYREKIAVQNINVGADYNINDNNIIGANYNLNYWDGTTNGYSTNRIENTSNLKIDSTYITNNRKPIKLNNQTFDLFYRHKIDDKGSKLDLGYNFIDYNNNQSSYLDNYFYDAASQPLRPEEVLQINNPLLIKAHTLNLDINKLYDKNLNVKFGAKYSNSNTNNVIQYYQGAQSVLDQSLSDNFTYREAIFALYASVEKKWDKWGINAGLRGENTDYKTISQSTSETYSSNKWGLFPSFFAHYKMSDDDEFNLSYGRRIDRPSFKLLNPFENIQDPLYITQGNPYLHPYFSNKIEFSYLFKKKNNFTIMYQVTTDAVNNIFLVNGNNQTISTYGNIDTEKMFLFSYSTYYDLFKWWNLSMYANTVYRVMEEKVAPYTHSERLTPFIRVSNTFKIQDNFFVTIDGSYFSKTYYSIYELFPQGSVNLSIRKSFLKNKLNTSLYVSDLLNTKHIRMDVRDTDFNRYIQNKFATRSISLRISYNFNSGKKSTDRQNMDNVKENESNRINQ